jgi:hypothetical protein
MFSFGRSAVPLFAAALLTAAAMCAQAAQYDFQIVARTGSSIGGYTIVNFNEPALLNDSGEVVFSATHSGGQGIFTPDQPLVKTGDTIDGKQLSSVSSPALNANGNIVFLAGFPGGSAIFNQANALIKTGDTIGGQPIFSSIVVSASTDLARSLSKPRQALFFQQDRRRLWFIPMALRSLLSVRDNQ